MHRQLFLISAVFGIILPYLYFVPFILDHGPDVGLFFKHLFSNRISAFFAMDVIVTSIILWLFIFLEGQRQKMKHLWIYIVCNLVVGVSLALPLFLFFREGVLIKQKRN